MKAEEARDFIGLRISADDGTVTHVELRFLLVTADHPALVYEYWKAVGDGKAVLGATLQDEPQAELPLEESKQEPQATVKFQCDHCDNDVPLDGFEHLFPDGTREPCQHANAGPPLASRAHMETVGA